MWKRVIKRSKAKIDYTSKRIIVYFSTVSLRLRHKIKITTLFSPIYCVSCVESLTE